MFAPLIAIMWLIQQCYSSNTDTSIWILNYSPFVLQYKNPGSPLVGFWSVPPPVEVAPDDENWFQLTPITDSQGTEATVEYTLLLGDSNRVGYPKNTGSFELHFRNNEENEVSLTYTLIPVTQLEKSQLIQIVWFGLTGDPTCNFTSPEWKEEFVQPGDHPICIVVLLSFLTTSGADLFKETIIPNDKKDQELIRNCLFTQPILYEQSFIMDSNDSSYNTIGWSIGDTKGIFLTPFLNQSMALKFYSDHGFTRVDCLENSDADLLVHCVKDSISNDCIPEGKYLYTLASLKIQGLWTFKVKDLQVFSYINWADIVNQNCGYGQRVGPPALCFKKNSEQIALIPKTSLRLNLQEIFVMQYLLSSIPVDEVNIFENVFSNLTSTKTFLLNECWDDQGIDNILELIRQFNHQKVPLLIKKMLDTPASTKAVAIYDLLPEIHCEHHKTNNQESEQIRAFLVAQKWLVCQTIFHVAAPRSDF